MRPSARKTFLSRWVRKILQPPAKRQWRVVASARANHAKRNQYVRMDFRFRIRRYSAGGRGVDLLDLDADRLSRESAAGGRGKTSLGARDFLSAPSRRNYLLRDRTPASYRVATKSSPTAYSFGNRAAFTAAGPASSG